MKSESLGVAVVTGAAGGIGASFAEQLGERGYRLLLVDCRPEPLQQVCAAIAAKYGVQAEAYAADLCQRDEVERLAQRLADMPDLELLVNNAGFGTVGYFVDTDSHYLATMVDLHIVTPTVLTRAVLPGMLRRNRGSIINVSSLGSWFQSAGNVQYGSTKNFLAVFSLGLQDELRGTNVSVQALCPGFVRTPFHHAETMKGYNAARMPAARWWMTPDQVVACSLRKLGGRQVIVIPGLFYRLMGRLAQMPLLRPIFQRFTRLPRIPENVMPSPAQPAENFLAPNLGAVKRA
jgi:short-subunit dehydrogenase